MFCKQCGASALDRSKFCKQCGHRFKESRISNNAMLLAGIAALVSVGSAALSYWPRSSPTETATTAAISAVAASPNPTPLPPIAIVKATPRFRPAKESEPEKESGPRPTPKPYRPRPEPTPDYPYRHTPSLVWPTDGIIFNHYPRKLVLRWKATPESEADGYKVTIECGDPFRPVWWKCHDIETPWTRCTIDFDGAQPGRWRVTPILANGRSGIPTEWRTFRFTQ